MKDNENEKQNKIEEVKIITLGDTQVGKSSFIIKFIEDRFSTTYLSTIGLDFKHKKITLPKTKQEVNVRIYDTAGQERYKTITVNYIKKANGALLIYDVTNKDSFLSVSKWVEDIKNKQKSGDKMAVVLVGNKCDLKKERVISFEEGEKKANEFELPFFETSCKDGTNIENVFIKISELILSKKNKNENTDPNTISKLKKGNAKQQETSNKKECC